MKEIYIYYNKRWLFLYSMILFAYVVIVPYMLYKCMFYDAYSIKIASGATIVVAKKYVPFSYPASFLRLFQINCVIENMVLFGSLASDFLVNSRFDLEIARKTWVFP